MVSDSLYAACLLLGGAVFPPILLFGLRHPCTGVYSLLGGARSWCPNVSLQKSSHRWMLPSISTTNVYVPKVGHSHLPLPQENPQDQQVGLAHASIKLLLLPLVLVCVRFCVHPLRVKSISPIPVRLLNLSPAGLQNQMSRGLCSWCRTPGLGSLTWGSELSLLWENLCNIIILQFVGCPPRGMGLDYITSLHILLWFLLYIFSCRSFLIGSGLFHRWLFWK